MKRRNGGISKTVALAKWRSGESQLEKHAAKAAAGVISLRAISWLARRSGGEWRIWKRHGRHATKAKVKEVSVSAAKTALKEAESLRRAVCAREALSNRMNMASRKYRRNWQPALWRWLMAIKWHAEEENIGKDNNLLRKRNGMKNNGAWKKMA